MEDHLKSRAELLAEIQILRDRLATSEETLQAIQHGEIDALVISTPQGERIFTLQSADYSYRLLVEEMQQGAAIVSNEGFILYCNKSLANLLQQPLEKLIGSDFQRLISSPDIPLFEALVQQVEKGERNSVELFLNTLDAVEVPVYLSINHLSLDESAVNCIVITDLTAQKHYEKTLAAERLARLILEQAGEAILVTDQNGQIIRASQIACQLWGENLLLQPFDSRCSLYLCKSNFSAPTTGDIAIARTNLEPGSSLKIPFSIASVIHGESYQGLEVEFECQDGQVLNLVLNARPLTDKDNHFHGAVVILTDITQRKQVEEALRERERLFATLAEASPIAIFRFDPNSNCVYVNNRWSEMTGRPAQTALGMGWVQTLHPEDSDRLTREWLQWSQNCQKKGLYHNEGKCIRPDGSVVRFYVQALPEVDSGGNTVGYVGILTDITAIKQAETAIRESQIQLQQQLAEIEAIYQSAPIGLNFLDSNLRFVRINQRLAEMNGVSIESHIGRTVREVLPELADAVEEVLCPILEKGEPVLNVEISGETPAQPGVQRTWLESFLPLKNGDRVIGINTVCQEITERKRIEAERQYVQEALKQAKEELEIRVTERTAQLHQMITELQQAEEHIKASLQEKEVLLKEIHHRVKNNLGIVSSLLQMQIRRTQNSQAKLVLQDSQNRIASIALVHEKLYRSEDLANINFTQYIRDLTVSLFDSYNISSNQIKLNLQLENSSLDIETIIPCGLIINELVSNALKHAFPGEHEGEIQVKFFHSYESLDNLCRCKSTLIIQDNGIGLPHDFTINQAKTLGLNLVYGLVKQIDGTIEINRQQGTEFKISFMNMVCPDKNPKFGNICAGS
ncbi:MAG: PAS domain S-box protein [Aulosira sp. ZfuVER01]|nr:PAS domain S-box protein [Aulosira sp. ZfuVER01]MDZ7997146.1 PAS domain S-box protein [Aulosira sp. DedVER01a]MDZ8052768.1 PAS domain S-box protein [Aulosira sp. ZfuCHP01]